MRSLVARFRGEGLGALAMRGAVWTFLGFGLQNLLRLGSNLILTRLLAPEIFGLMALANVALTALTLLSDVGTKASVIRSDRGEDPAFLRTIWTVQVLRGFLIAGVACALAWPASQLYDEPLLFPLICLISLSAVFQGFQSVAMATMNRDLNIFRLTLLTTLVQALSIVITISAAYLMESVWALAIGAVSNGLLTALLSHVMLPRFRHRFAVEREALREIIGFGRWILIGTILTYFGGQGGQMIMGLLVPLDILGLIAIAALIGRLPSQMVLKVQTAVVFPSFSRVRRERPQDLPRVLAKVRLVFLAGTLPVLFGGALLAQPIIDLLYDPRYAAAGFVLALILCEDAIGLLSAPYQNLMLSEGNSRYHALVMGLWAGARALGMVAGFSIAGLPGMYVGMGLGTVLMVVISAGFAWRAGYASKWLDIGALAVTIGFYAFVLTITDVPEIFLVPG